MDSDGNNPIKALKAMVAAGEPRYLCFHLRQFLNVTLPKLMQEPPPRTEPYTPNDDIPKSPYIPLGLR
jgi:hypothetical protein